MTKTKKRTTKAAARILIVDDHPAVREALTIRFSREPDLEVCGEAAEVIEALHLVETCKPDLAIIDIALRNGDGIDFKRIKARNDSVRMLVWSMYGESLYAERALRAGAMGYITKEEATDQIVVAIRQVLKGKMYLSEPLAEELLHRAVREADRPVVRSPIDALSDRELTVYRLVGQGLKTQEIAERLHVSGKTIETYRDRIRSKLGLESGTELARSAIQWVLENG